MSITYDLIRLIEDAMDKRLLPQEIRMDWRTMAELRREFESHHHLSMPAERFGDAPKFRDLPIVVERRVPDQRARGPQYPVSEVEPLPVEERFICVGARERGEHGRWVYLQEATS